MPKLFMVMSEEFFLLTHRKEIAVEAVKQGFDVTLIAKNTGRRAEIEALGVKMIDLPINPTGMNLWQELKTLWFLFRLYCREQPDIIHHIGLKTVLWGGLAARIAQVRANIINAISGLGITFSDDRLSITARGILAVIRLSTGKHVKFIFQNPQDEELFIKHRITTQKQTVFIKGSGVDLSKFAYVPIPETSPVKVIFTARMVEEKGVVTLIEAANKLRQKYTGHVEFLLCGGLSKNPKAISKQWLDEHCDGQYIKWLGHRNDIRELLEKSHIVAFPSYYREGVPKSLIEACAIGRPIITCDSIGCRDTVEDGHNGFLIPIKNSDILADKLRILIENPELRVRMGLESRKKAELEFSVEDVVNKHLALYKPNNTES